MQRILAPSATNGFHAPSATNGFHAPDSWYWHHVTQKPNNKQCSPFVLISAGNVKPIFYIYGLLSRVQDSDIIVHSIFGYRHFVILTYRYTGQELKTYWQNRHIVKHATDSLPINTQP